MAAFSEIRRNMVDTQLRTYDVTSKRLLDAVENVPREFFIPADQQALAYGDQQMTVGSGQGGTRALLAPMVLARMIQAADITAGSRILDVAGGSGYGAAIMASMGGTVTMLENSDELGQLARGSLAQAGFSHVAVHVGGLDKGLPDASGFDVIFINGAIAIEPSTLLKQLNDGGRLVAVVGSGRSGRVTLFQRNGDSYGRRAVFDAAAPGLAAFREAQGFSF